MTETEAEVMKFESRRIPIMRKDEDEREKEKKVGGLFVAGGEMSNGESRAETPSGFHRCIPTRRPTSPKVFIGLGVTFFGAGVAATDRLRLEQPVTFPGISSDKQF